MDFKQSHYTNKTSFRFDSEGFAYFLKDRSGSRNSFIRYDGVFLNQRFEIEEKSEYFRNVGFIWVLLGIIFSVTSHTINFWVYVGIICLAVYYVLSTKYTVIPTSQGNVFILQGEHHDEILDMLTQKVRGIILSNFGEIDYGRTFEDERRKYKTLLDSGIIGESKFNEYCEILEKNRDQFKKEE